MKQALRTLAVALAMLGPARLLAVTVGPGWCVAYPEPETNGDNFALKIAATEIARDIKEATGLELKVLRQSQATAPAIYVGAAFAEKAGFDLSGYEWYDNAIAEKGGSIYLFGRDRMGRDPAKMSPKRPLSWWFCVLPSVRAATRFLESAVGVRFLMPGEVGKEVPKRKEVSLADGSLDKESPQQIFGNARSPNNSSMMYYIANGLWGMGAFHTYGGHTYPDACPGAKYFKDHPEYFALVNGKRLAGLHGQAPLCISNPAVEDLIVKELEKRFDLGADVCQLAQQDGGKVCGCDACRAMYGTGDDWGEKLWLFHRHIAERILKERPGKIVHILNYGTTIKPPKTFKVFPPNVMIEMCRYSEAAFQAWKAYTVPHGFTVYVYLAGNYQTPGFVARHCFATFVQLAKRFRANKVRGVYRCGSIGDLYGTEGPGYYVFHKMLQDDSLNVRALVAEYCAAAFGPASDLMLRFYETLDARLRMYDRIAEPFPQDLADGMEGYCRAKPKNALVLHGLMFAPDVVALMEENLSRAEKMDGLSAKQRKRLELVRLEFDYAKGMGAIATLHAAYKLRPSKESLAPLLDEIERRNAYIERLFGGKNTPKRIEGWPELTVFGHGCSRGVMAVNGRMSATIGAPLTWPVADIRASGVLPGVTSKRTDAERVAAPPTFDAFAAADGWNALGGITMEKTSMSARFKALYDEKALYLLVESDLAEGIAVTRFPQDGPVWTDDCIDILLAPGATRDVHYHFVCGEDPVSRYDDATGLIKDPLDPLYGKPDRTWNGSGWKTASRREGGTWRAIVTFPYSDFGVDAPKRGDSWFVNVGRIAKTGADRKGETLMLWSPNVESRSMVAPNAMGKVTFR